MIGTLEAKASLRSLLFSLLVLSAYGCGESSDVKGACGDGVCDDDETTASCPDDCGDVPPTCGDGQVDPGEDCDHAADVEGCVACRFECTDDAECDDGNPCTAAAECLDLGDRRHCAEAMPIENGTICGEELGCFDGECVPRCTFDEDCVGGSECGGYPTCDDGLCVATPKDDGETCTPDEPTTDRTICLGGDCAPSICGDGFVDGENGEECEGGFPCFECRFAECDPAAEVDECADAGLCQTGVCDAETFECVAGADRPDGTPCGDGQVCLSGACAPGCADDEACAGESPCRAAASCNLETYQCEDGAPVSNGTACGDDSVCVAGECVAGCAVSEDCESDDLCREAPSCLDFACVEGAPVTDGTACGEGRACRTGECITAACTADEHCTTGQCREPSVCDGDFRCVSGAPLMDGTGCDAGGDAGVCSSGSCVAADCTSDAECGDDDPCSGLFACEIGACVQTTAPLSHGESCGAGLVCVEESCVSPECTSDDDCHGGDICGGESCDLASFTCDTGPIPADGTSCGPDEMDVCLDGSCVAAGCLIDADCDDENPCNGQETCDAYACAAGTSLEDGAPCGGDGVCEAGECVAAARYCDVVYRFATGDSDENKNGRFHNIKNGTGAQNVQIPIGWNAAVPSSVETPFTPTAFPQGFMRLRFPADQTGSAPVAGAVEIIEFYLPVEFSVTQIGTTVATNVDYSAGMLSYSGTDCGEGVTGCLPEGTSWSLERACTPVATGAVSGTSLSWAGCGLGSPSAWTSTDDSPSTGGPHMTWFFGDSQIDTGANPGCLENLSSVGRVTCSGLGCAFVPSGVVGPQNSTWDQELSTFEFSGTDYASARVTIPEVIIPTPPQLDDTYSGMSTLTSQPGILAECGTLAELTCDER